MDEIDVANQEVESFREAALMRYLRTLSSRAAPIAGTGIRICLDCGDEIDTARLRAVPAAVRCLECQARAERRARHG